MKVKVLFGQLCLTFCDCVDYSPPGSFVHGIPQARILEWVAIPFSRGSSWPRDQAWVSCIAGRFFTIWATKSMVLHEPHDFRVLPPGANLKIEKLFFTWGHEILFYCLATILFTHSKNVVFNTPYVESLTCWQWWLVLTHIESWLSREIKVDK